MVLSQSSTPDIAQASSGLPAGIRDRFRHTFFWGPGLNRDLPATPLTIDSRNSRLRKELQHTNPSNVGSNRCFSYRFANVTGTVWFARACRTASRAKTGS